MAMKRCIYTVLTNDYDTLKPPVVVSPGFDYICFTDNHNLQCAPWQIRYISPEADPVKQQRKIKILPHVFLSEYSITVYIDASTQLVDDVAWLVTMRFTGGMLLKQHPVRDCVYEEAKRCVELGKAKKEDVDKQVFAYLRERIPEKSGLYETGIMVRENSHAVNAVSEAWYREVEKYTHRDQIALPAVLHRLQYYPATMSARQMNRYIRIHKHSIPQPKQKPRIWHLTPFATDKNIGKEYNAQIAQLPADDWVCLRDGDTMYLTPGNQWGKQIEDIVAKHGEDFDLIGCITNRLKSTRQLYKNKFSNDPNILNHADIAQELYESRYDIVRKYSNEIAGLFLLFPVKLWRQIRFEENTIYFDSLFSRAVLKAGKRIGLAEGIYLFHFYRWWSDNPAEDKKHLL